MLFFEIVTRELFQIGWGIISQNLNVYKNFMSGLSRTAANETS